MRRRRITEIFPFLLPLRKFQRKLFFYLGMYFDGNMYAKKISEDKLSYKVYEAESLIVNKDSGFDIQYQINKGYNLKLASDTINGLIIKPNQVFSFWQLVRYADKYQAYKDGLNLVNGEIVASYGGGLCQLSIILYWAFLHSPLTIIERHGHEVENFAPASPKAIAGVDATISEGWKDLKVKNGTENNYQIIIDFQDGSICISILSDAEPLMNYEIFNKNLEYLKVNNEVFQETLVFRKEINNETMETKEVFLYKDKSKINYKFDDKRIINEREAV